MNQLKEILVYFINLGIVEGKFLERGQYKND